MKKLFLLILTIYSFNVLNCQWQLINSPGKASVYAIGYDSNIWYAITGSGLFMSTNDGNDWNTMGYLGYNAGNCILNEGGTIYIGSDKGVYYSTDASYSWELMTEGLLLNQYISSSNIIVFSSNSMFTYALTPDNLYSIDKNKKKFIPVEIDTFSSYKTMYVSEKYLLVGSGSHTFLPRRGPNIFISKDNGITWKSIADTVSGIDILHINCFSLSNDTIYAGTSNGIYASYDEGVNWKLLINGLSGYEITNLLITQDGAYAGTKSGMFYASAIGEFWEKKEHGLTNNYRPSNILSMSNINGKILAGTSHGLFYTIDKGENWMSINNGLGGGSIGEIKESSGKIYANLWQEGLFSSDDSGQSWSLIADLSTQIISGPIAVDNNNIYMASNRKWAFFYSSDNGVKWNIVPDSLAISGRKIFSFYLYNHNVIACTDNGLFISEDSAKSWSSLLGYYMYNFVYFDNNYIYAGSIGQGLLKSTDNGGTWKQDSTVFGANNTLTDILKTERGIFVASYGSGVFKSTDNSSSWDSVNVGLSNKYITSMVEYNNNIFCSTQNGIFLTTNSGEEWKEVSDGLTKKYINKLLIFGVNIYAGSAAGLFKAKVSDFGIVDVKDDKIVEQNKILCYPNPTTNTINLHFHIESSGMINIFLTDILGNQTILKTEYKFPGDYVETFNLSVYPQGIYNIVLQTENRNYRGNVIINR